MTVDLVKELRTKAKINAVPYVSAPAGVNNFIMSVQHAPERLRVWQGRTAEFDIDGDRSAQQAVLTVREPQRSFKRQITIFTRRYGYDGGLLDFPRDRAFTNRFPIALPTGARFTVSHHQWVRAVPPWTQAMGRAAQQDACVAIVTARLPQTTQPFLVGMDETAYFIAMLHRPAKDVADAHKALRPTRLPDTTVRQGEWFFTPATPKELLAINNALRTGRARPTYSPLENGSTHEALYVNLPDRRFAIGVVQDTREGHHTPLTLTNWHKVVRNREVVVRQTQVTSMVRTRHWD